MSVKSAAAGNLLFAVKYPEMKDSVNARAEDGLK